MSITDELREYAHDCCARVDDAIHDIADRIDAEHQKAMSRAGQLLADAEKDRDYNYANWQDCKQKVLQGNITFGELNARIERLEDELSHRIELPKDADGETWHIGDRTESGQTIEAMGLNKHGWHFVGTVNEIDPAIHRHHAPTVEDVLTEMLAKAIERGELTNGAAQTIAEYASKLRLREDA